MALGFVQATSGTNISGVSQGAVWAGNTTTGNGILAAIGSASTSPKTGCSDTQNNNYQYLGQTSNTFNGATSYWYCPNITGGTTPTVTATIDFATAITIEVQEFSGFALVNPYDTRGVAFSSVANTTGAINTTLASTRTPNEMVIFICHTTATATVGAATGYTNLNAATNGVHQVAMQSKVVSVTGFQSASSTLGASTRWDAAILTFSDTTVEQATVLNDYQFIRAGDGMSVTEKIR